MGRVNLNGEPFQEDQEDKNKQIRKAWVFPLKLIDSPKVKIDLDIEEDNEVNLDEIEEFVIEDAIDKRASIEEPPPKGKRVPSENPSFKGKKTDFNKQNKNRKIIGDKGEQFVIEYEISKLLKLGRDDLASQVEHVSKTQGDGTGYDIRTFDESGNEIYIEVKTTTGTRNKPFNISWVEFERSKLNSSKYYLYRVYNFNPNKMIGNMYILKGDLVCWAPVSRLILKKFRVYCPMLHYKAPRLLQMTGA